MTDVGLPGQLTLDPSCRSSSPTRSTAGPQGVGAALPERADSSMPSSHSSSWHAPSTSCSSTLPAWARASSLRLLGMQPSGPTTPFASCAPPTPSEYWHKRDITGTSEIRSLLRQDLPLPGPAHPRRPRPTQDAPTAVNGPKRVGHRQASKGQLRHHLNRAVDEWLGLFDDPILGNDALDRLANANYQIVTEGQCCRERLSTHKALLD